MDDKGYKEISINYADADFPLNFIKIIFYSSSNIYKISIKKIML